MHFPTVRTPVLKVHFLPPFGAELITLHHFFIHNLWIAPFFIDSIIYMKYSKERGEIMCYKKN